MSRGRPSRLTQSQREEIRRWAQLRDENTTKGIARRLGVPVGSVTYELKKLRKLARSG